MDIFFLVFNSFGSAFFIFSFISLASGKWKAKETITAIGTASSTPKNPIIVQHNIMHINTTRGLTHKLFHMRTGTNIFSSDCWIIIYKIITARNHHQPENIRAEIAAGIHHKNGQTYGIISNIHASTARVSF